MNTAVVLSFADYQRLAARTEKVLPHDLALQHGILGILTEAGELADLVKRQVIYNKPAVSEYDVDSTDKTPTIEEELGDIFWYLAVIANNSGVDLGQAAAKNIAKLQKRYPEKYTNEAALARADKT